MFTAVFDIGINLCIKLVFVKELSPTHDFSEKWIPTASLEIRELPQCKLTWFSCVSECPHRLQYAILIIILQDIDASNRVSSFFHVYDDFFVLFVFQIDDKSISISENCPDLTLHVPFLLLWLFDCFRQVNAHLGSSIIWTANCLDLCQTLHDHMYPEGRFLFNNVNFVNPFPASDHVRSPSSLQ